MPRRAPRIDDPALVAVLDEALQRGALALPDACRTLRAIDGLTQAQFAARAGVALKVVKALENDGGNPTLDSLNRIASLAGLQVALVKPRAMVKLGTADQFTQRQARSRSATLRAAKKGKSALKEHHERSALRGKDFTIDLPRLRRG